jgi:hypothetical protein
VAFKQQLFLLKRQRTFWLILSLFLIILISNSLSLYRSVNAFFYTTLANFSHTQESNVVVIESEFLVNNHNQVVDKLLSYSPRSIIVIANEPLFTLQHSRASNVYYPHPKADVCLPSVLAWSSYNIMLNNESNTHCKTVWSAVYPEYDFKGQQLLNFALAPSALPKFTAQRLLSNDILTKQLKDKIIIVGQQNVGLGVSLNTPKLKESNNYLYLVAYTADTLEKQASVLALPIWQSIILQIVLAISLLFLYQKTSIKNSLLLAVTFTLAWCLIGYFAITLKQIYIPLGQLTVLTFFCLFWIVFVRKLNEDSELITIIGNIQQKMVGRYLPKSFIEQSSPWDPIIHLINQHLDLNKSIFLARKEGDHRLSEIRAINCQITDIKEMRRDYKRAPYSDALKVFGVIKIERQFFEKIEDGETQYIVPLIYAGDVRGFWAMTVIPSEHFNEQAFEKNVNQFASQVGELLFHHHIYETQEKLSQNLFSRLITLRIREPLSHQVKSSIAEMEQKLSTLEHMFNHIRSATVQFNLFGQLVQTNKSLEQLAVKHQLPIFEMSALDLLCKTTNLNLEEAKGKLRYITLNKAETYLEASLDGTIYILNVRSISASHMQSASGEPFQMSGISFEFIDIAFFIDELPNSETICDFICEKQKQKPEQRN